MVFDWFIIFSFVCRDLSHEQLIRKENHNVFEEISLVPGTLSYKIQTCLYSATGHRGQIVLPLTTIFDENGSFKLADLSLQLAGTTCKGVLILICPCSLCLRETEIQAYSEDFNSLILA